MPEEIDQEIDQEIVSKKPSRLPIILVIVVAAGLLGFFAYSKINSRRKVELLDRTEEKVAVTPVESLDQTEEKISSEGELTSASGFLLTITSPINNSTVKTASIIVKGETVPGAEVWVNETQATVDQKGNYSAAITLQEGENYILVAGGNEAGDTEIERTVYFEK